MTRRSSGMTGLLRTLPRNLTGSLHRISGVLCALLFVGAIAGLLDPTTVTKAISEASRPLATSVDSWSPNGLAVSRLEVLERAARSEVGQFLMRFASLLLSFWAARAALRQYAIASAWARVRRLNFEARRHGPWHEGLLPSQRAYVEDFLRELISRPHDLYSAKIMAVQGVWGSGKTTVVQAMRRALAIPYDQWGVGQAAPCAQGLRFVPAYMNAWRDENPDDLHERLVERIFLCPGVLESLGWGMQGLSTRFLWAMRGPVRSNANGPRSKWLTSIVGRLSQAEVKAQWEFNPLPSKLTHQEDLELIVARLRCRRRHLVLFIDELDRGTPKTAQAMLVMLRRSLDLGGVHLVVPFVQQVLDELAFNPIYHESPELTASSLAVLAAADVIGRPDDEAIRGVSLNAYAAAAKAGSAVVAKSPAVAESNAISPAAPAVVAGGATAAGTIGGATQPEVSARADASHLGASLPAQGTATPTLNIVVQPISPTASRASESAESKVPTIDANGSDTYERVRVKRRDQYRESLLNGYMSLNRRDRDMLQRRISEKYIGFLRPLPRATPEDLAWFAWNQRWLRHDDRFGWLLRAALEQSLKRSAEAAQRSVLTLFELQGDDERKMLQSTSDRIRYLLARNRGAPYWPALAAGSFSWRSFESYLGQIVAQPRLVEEWPNQGVVDDHPQADRELMCGVLAHTVFAALALFSFEQGCPPQS